MNTITLVRRVLLTAMVYPFLLYLTARFFVHRTLGELTFLPGWFLMPIETICIWAITLTIYFKYLLVRCTKIAVGDYGLIISNPLTLQRVQEGKSYTPIGQREVVAGKLTLLDPWESILGDPISLKWRRIDIPKDFKAKTKVGDGIELGFKGFMRARPLVGHLVTYNQHTPESIDLQFSARMTLFITGELANKTADEIPLALVTMTLTFNKEHREDVADQDEKTFGVETSKFVLSDFTLPPEIEAANRVGKVLEKLRTEAQEMVRESGGTLSFDEALFYASLAAGIINPQMEIFKGLDQVFGRGKKNQQKQDGGK